MKYPILVLAGNRRQYLNYLEDLSLSKKEAVFVDTLESIQGLLGSAVVITGTFYERENCKDLEALALSRCARATEAEWFTPYLGVASRLSLEYLATRLLKGLCQVEQEKALNSIGTITPEWSGSTVSNQGN